ncbi:response regulator [Paenibacillus filicis]|uniref:Response regulator n=1 Tax=Paenibacillus filicis TaxID=669464 RepID=A0ABU9DIU3_9BACL
MSHYQVWVADDERMIREGIAGMIQWEELGLTLAGTAADGQAAYLDIRKHRPDIVITDIKMPRLSGLELIRKTQEEHADIIFIVLSGYGEFELAAQAMKFGVRHYLLKPSDEKEIMQVLQEVKEELDARRNREREFEGLRLQLAETERRQETAGAGASGFYAYEDGGSSSHSRAAASTEGEPPAAAEEEERLQRIVAAVRHGDDKELEQGLEAFFQALFEQRSEPKLATGRCMELLDAVLREAVQSFGYKRESDGVRIWQMKTLMEIRQYIERELAVLMDSRKELHSGKRSRVVVRIKQLTAEHLENRQLSLQWLAQYHLFLNSEYLGKLFSQETGEKYTRYLTVRRMERAKELIEAMPQLKMYEVAERCGFEQDPQYFAHVFKKINGCSPAEYRKRLSGEAE